MEKPPSDDYQRRDPITRELLKLLYQKRKEKDWTVRDLARHAGISPSYVSLIENGHKIPDIATIEKLGRALNIDENLMAAWVTVRSRDSDPRVAGAAAHELMEHLSVDQFSETTGSYSVRELEAPLMRLQSPAITTRASFPDTERFVVGIPLFDEGAAPGVGDVDDPPRERRPFWIDKRMLPERDELRGAWAWRLSLKSAGPGRGIYRRGSTVVLSPDAWSPQEMNARMVFAVRVENRVVLSRISLTGNQLILLPTEEAEIMVLDVFGDSRIRDIVLARVVLEVARYW